jgi:hypothetical protein
MKTCLLLVAGLVLCSINLRAQAASPASAQAKAPPPPPPPAAPTNQPSAVTNYQVSVLPANIAPTPATQSNGKAVEVSGEPLNVVGHPCTLVDSKDIERYKTLLKTNADAQKSLSYLKDYCDKRITQPLDVPIAQKAPDGSWMWPGDFPLGISPLNVSPKATGIWVGVSRVGRTNSGNADSIAQLGMMYQLSGDVKYGEYCKKLLLGYADNYAKWGHTKGWTPGSYRSAYDGRLSPQFLNDGGMLIQFALGYDLVYSLPSWTKEEHDHVRDDFFKPLVAQFIDPILGDTDYLSQNNNRSALCGAGVLMAGYATEDQEMVNDALYGSRKGTKENPTGGIIKVHFGETCLLPDGMWVEGAPGYQLGIASCGLFDDAETLWRHGIDMYRYRNGALKRLLDSGPALAYPDAKMTVAALHDSGQFQLLTDAGWLNTEIGDSYERGYVRYKDPHYLPVIRNAQQSLNLSTHCGGPSLFLDLPPAEQDPPRAIENVNFYSVGYGILRQSAPLGANQLLMEYGVSAGHSHPSKLGIDVYALGAPLMMFPGVIFPYDSPLNPNWFSTGLSNCDMVIDERIQHYAGDYQYFPRNSPTPVAEQLVFGPASTMGIQRAWSNTIYAQPHATGWAGILGKDVPPQTMPFTQVNEDRSLFLTPEYLADIFGGFSTGPHKYDLAWHIKGDMTATLAAKPFSFPAPVPLGYNAMQDVTLASSDQAWTATVTTDNKQTVRFLAPGGTATEVYLGKGPDLPAAWKTAPSAMIMQRRADVNNVIFGNAADLSGDKDGYLKSVTQEGSLDAGYGLLKLETVKGTDLCFTAFRPGSYTAGGLTTDAMQAMVRMDGANVQAMYLGGGTTLKASGATIQRSEPGLAYVEKAADGSYVVGNPSPTKATVTVTLPAIGGAKKLDLDAGGKWTNATTTAKQAATQTH